MQPCAPVTRTRFTLHSTPGALGWVQEVLMKSVWVVAGIVLSLPARGAEVPAGTHLLLRMMNSVSTRTAQAGDYVYLRTCSPIVSGGKMVAPVDSYVQGVVSHAQRSGR